MYNPAAPFDPPRDILTHYTSRAQDAEYVALQNYGIRDMMPLMQRLSQLKHMKHLNISGNDLSRLPEDMSSLSTLEILDVSQNEFRDAQSVITGLYSLPRLRHLKITLPEEEENKIVAILTNVLTLNGVDLDVEDTDSEEAMRKAEKEALKTMPPPPRGYELTSESVAQQLNYEPWSSRHVEKFSNLYGLVGKVSGKASSPQEYEDFERTVMSHFRARCKGDADVLKLQVHQFNAAALLLEFSFDELSRVCSRFGADVGIAFQSIFEHHLELVRKASVTLNVMQNDRDRRIAAVQEDLQKEILLRERMQRAYEENFGATIAGGRMQFSNEEMQKAPSPYGLPQVYPNHEQHNESSSGREKKETVTDERLLAMLFTHVKGQPMHVEVNLPELRAFIRAVFKSKKVHDEGNALARLPPETLEQHMYTCMCNRTNQEEVIKSRINAVFKSIAKFAAKELDILIISKILKNELDEHYYAEHLELEGTIFDMIHKVLVRSSKDASITISALLKKAQNTASGEPEEPLAKDAENISGIPADGLLTERQVKDVIDLVTPWPADRKQRLSTIISKKMHRKELDPNAFDIGYTVLVQLVLRFFLDERCEQIAALVGEFRIADSDKTGVIDINQFKRILAVLFLDLSSWKAQQIANASDPFNNNVVNFSTAVKIIRAFKQQEGVASQQRVADDINSRRSHLIGEIPRSTSSADQYRNVFSNQPQPGGSDSSPSSSIPAGKNNAHRAAPWETPFAAPNTSAKSAMSIDRTPQVSLVNRSGATPASLSGSLRNY